MGNKWRIKCRIAKKNDRRTWRNDRGEGYLLNVELVDEDGARI
jgi:replication factor A1